MYNLLAALSLDLVDEATLAAERATGVVGSATPALIALSQFLNRCNVARLADVLGLSHSGAVRLVGQLEDAGYVRRAHLADRRQVNVVLTSKGRRAACSAAAARKGVVAAATSRLTRPERRQLEPLLAKVVDQVVTLRARNRIEQDGARAWFCRACELTACGRPDGRCPAANAAATVAAE